MHKFFNIPFLVLFFLCSSVFMMIIFRFVNFRIFFSRDKSVARNAKSGEVSRLRAFFSAAGSTLGIGNIVGSAVAIKFGGAGSLFWIFVIALFLSIIKFAEVMLGCKYRVEDENGVISGGPFFYISKILNKFKLPRSGVFLTVVYVGLFLFTYTIASSFHINQISALTSTNILKTDGLIVYVFSVLLTIMCFAVLNGGIKVIGLTMNIVVPFMIFTHLAFCFIVIFSNIHMIIPIVKQILHSAFHPDGINGGLVFIITYSLQRLMYASDVGTGLVAVANSNTSGNKFQQAALASIEPILIAIMMIFTGLVILVTFFDGNFANFDGIIVVTKSFSMFEGFWFNLFMVNIMLFGITSIISNGYGVEKAFYYISNGRYIRMCRVVYCVVAFIFAQSSMHKLLPLIDSFYSVITFVNISVLLLAVREIRKDLIEYK